MSNKIGCLIVHGFGGSLKEITPLSDYLSERGIITYCPRLKGHTGNRKDFAQSKYSEWIKSAEDGLLHLKSKCEQIVVIGFSMGGLIAANLATKYDVAAIVTLNTPIYYWDIKRMTLNIIEDLKKKSFKSLRRYIKASFYNPLPAMINFKRILSETKPLFSKIQCPILIVQALKDDTVQHRSAEFIYQRAASKVKEIKYYTNSGHLICLSQDCNDVFKDISEFIGAIEEIM